MEVLSGLRWKKSWRRSSRRLGFKIFAQSVVDFVSVFWHEELLINWAFFVLIVLVDIISATEFDKTGDYLAVGDRGGRVIIFETDIGKDVRNFHITDRNFFFLLKLAIILEFISGYVIFFRVEDI